MGAPAALLAIAAHVSPSTILGMIYLVAGVIAAVLTTIFNWPQAYRVLHKGTHGVSAAAVTLSILATAAWLGYGISETIWPVIVSNIGILLGEFTIFYVIKKTQAEDQRKFVDSSNAHRNNVISNLSFTTIFIYAFILVVTTSLLPIHLIVVYIASIVIVTAKSLQLQQAVQKRKQDLGGLSTATYSIALFSAINWVIFGVYINDLAVMLMNSILIIIFATILVIVITNHKLRQVA